MSQRKQIDCVIVGHNDSDFAAVEKDTKRTQSYSGAYLDLLTNTVNYEGQRMPYMTLLNRVLNRATGRPHDLHVCRLPHLGAALLKSFLCKRGFNIDVVNFYNAEKDRLVELLEQGPRAVAITTTLCIDNAPIIEIVKFIKQHNSDTKVIVGGPRIFNLCSTIDSATQDFVFREIGADIYIYDSQGELTLSRVLNEFRDGSSDLSGIPNLVYSVDNKYHRTPRIIEDNSMDENSVDWSFFNKDFYAPTAQTRTARSCAFKCSFCRYPAIAGGLALTDVDILEQELRFLHQAGVKNLVFIDDTFNVPLPRFKDLCRMMIRNGFEFNWFSFFRCSNSDDQAFDLMKESGCRGVFLGIESGDETILKHMNKFADVGRYKYGIEKLKERDIFTFASIIVGFPGETDESVSNTMKFLQETSPTFYRAEIYYHYTNVPIHDRAQEFGITSAGYSWKHNSMDWQKAGEYVKAMYRSIKGPTVLPSYMFDFWSIPYLMGQGIAVEQIMEFTKQAQKMMLRGLDQTNSSTAEDDRLTYIFDPTRTSPRLPAEDRAEQPSWIA